MKNKRILIVDDDSELALLHKSILNKNSFEVEIVTSGYECIERCKRDTYDLILLDVMMPEMDGLETCSELQKNGIKTPILMLSASNDEERIIRSLELGAHDYVTKPIKKGIFLARVRSAIRLKDYQEEQVRLLSKLKENNQKLEEANHHLELLSLEDGLLGIGNRRSLEINLKELHAMATRYQRPYGLLMIDVDFFKRYNDHYGHQAGDDVLKKVAATLKFQSRDTDRPFRYGGEEFVLLCPETPPEYIHIAGERVRSAIEALSIEHSESPHGIVTVSVGISGIKPGSISNEDVEDILRQADEALYAAKESGRNRVELWGSTQVNSN